jgi:outer membrane lipoprotein LolB
VTGTCWWRAWALAGALSALGALSACSRFPVRTEALAATAPDQQVLQGQLSIKLQAFQGLEAKGVSLGFFFNGNDQGGQLDLMTPLGSQVALVRWTPSDAWLQTDKGDRHFDSLGELSEQVLGEPLPLAALMHWVQGRPAPDLPAPTNTTAQSFEQSGWRIDTTDIAVGKLNAQRPASAQQRGITVRIRLD